MKTWMLASVCVVCVYATRAAQPLVAVHDSELTRALETMPASGATPQETGYQWWLEDWHYFVMPESVKEMLHSDGTAFAVVSDADISAGHLLDTNGRPAYPIVISLAAEAMNDSEIAGLTNYVAAGGFLFVGSSAFTRNPDGTGRGDFAIANAMGIHMASTNLVNWVANNTFTKLSNQRLVAHVTGGPLNWAMPRMASDISGGTTPNYSGPGGHLFWVVQPSDATVVAVGDASPYITIKHYGKGWFIYNAALEPLIGHGGFAPGMYSYGIFRNSIQWAFEAAKMPITKLSPWPYPYDAALMIRHDLQNLQTEIGDIAASAAIENAYGGFGDYYFNTGTLRVEMNNSATLINSLRQAVTNYNASIGPENGGLQNPDNFSLPLSSAAYWGWGPDEAFDVPTNSLPSGYTNGFEYALTSISNSFSDAEGWLSGLTNGIRSWDAPNFNATREGSYLIDEQLNVRTTGEDKLTPFPSWVLSTSLQTADKRYPFITLPVSDYFYGPNVPESMEAGHYPGSMHALVDTFYGIGGLINLNSSTLSTGEGLAGPMQLDYVTYALNPTIHPRLWSANALKIYSWWLARSNAQITTTCVTNGNQSTTRFSISGATDPETAVEMVIPAASVSSLQVLTNGVVASSTNCFRTNGQNIKIFVGTSITNAQVSYVLDPTARNDFYITMTGQTLTVPAANGVLSNDFAGVGTNLTASLVTGPAGGLLTLNANGSFSYTPATNFTGMDTFTYVANDGVTNSLPAVCTIDVTPAASLFYDDFGRSTNADPLAPWTAATGDWWITNGMMQGTASGINDYSDCYYPGPWRDYSVEAQVRLETNSWAGGLSGRVDSLSGSKYTANIYEEGLSGDPLAWPDGTAALRIIKFHTYRTWDLNPSAMTFVHLPPVGTNWHSLKLTFKGAEIKAFFDGTQVADVIDNNVDGMAPYLSGGISMHMYQNLPHVASFDNLIVLPLPSDDSYVTTTNLALNVPAPGVLGNDVEGQITNLTGALVSTTSHGNLTFNTDGSFTYVPATNFSGTDSFVYSASTGTNNLGQATVTITVNGGIPMPVLPAESNLVVIAQVQMVVTNTATDADSPPKVLSYNLTAAPTGAAINGNGIITWTPSPGQVGSTNTITTIVSDNSAPPLSATNSFTVVVSGSIAANNDSYNEPFGVPLTVSPPGVLANDLGGSGPLHAVLISGVAHGNLNFNTNGGFTYSATNNFAGTDSFTYQAIDGVTNSSAATVTINVAAYQPPMANNDNYTVLAGAPFSVPAPGVLINDTDAQGSTLTAILINGPANGTLQLNSNGGFTYTPNTGFNGTDGFTYMANDGVSNSSPATVSLSVLSSGILFYDSFTRGTDPGPLTPWVGIPAGNQLSDTWTVTGGTLQAGQTETLQTYAFAYLPSYNWTNFAVQGRIQFSDPTGVGGGIGGRLNPATGTHYGAWVYPDGSPGGANMLKLFKFTSYITFSYDNNAVPIQTTNLPSVGTNWHTLKLAFSGNQIAVYYDGNLEINTTDNEVQPYASGTICAERGTYLTDYNFLVDDVVVSSLGLPVQTNLTINELATLIVTNTATDTQIPGQTLTYSLLNPPSGATISTNGVITWSPAEGQGPSTNAITTVVADNGSPSMSATNSFTVTVNDVNVPPLLPAQTNRTTIGLATLVVTNTATDPNIPAATLSYGFLTAPTNAKIDTNGVIAWTPVPGQVPSTNLFTTVVTNFNPYAVTNQRLTATNTFTVTVNAIHNGPMLAAQPNRTVNEFALLTVTNAASDSDVPALTLSYQLLNPPAGAAIDTNGVITWTPAEGQGPSTNVITTLVADNGSPSMSATNSFAVTVNDVNVPPVLPVQTNRTIIGLAVLVVTNTAMDPNIPAATLSYGFLAAPTNATIDTNGVIAWTPVPGQVPGTNLFTTVVTNFNPYAVTNQHLTATNAFTVVVQVRLPPVIGPVNVSSGFATLSWSAMPGQNYELQFKDDLTATNWTNVLPIITATGSTASATNSIEGVPQRFYRILVVP